MIVTKIVTKHKSIPNARFSKKRGLDVLHLNGNSLLPKIDDIHYIHYKKSNGISELVN